MTIQSEDREIELMPAKDYHIDNNLKFDDSSSLYGPNPFADDRGGFGPEPNTSNITNPTKTTEEGIPQLWEVKAAEIESRTRELHNRQASLRGPGSIPMSGMVNEKNWPPFFPLLYHDIEAELPSSGQSIAKSSFFIWQLTAGAYILNFVTTLLMLFSGVEGYSSLTGTIFAAIYAVLFPGLAFITWHMSLYKALKFDSSFWYIAYFVSFGLQLVFYAFLAVGLFSGGGGGILGMLEMFTKGKFIVAIFAAICAAGMAVCFLMGLGVVKRVNDHFRNNGHSVERAGAEAGRSVAQNESVRKAAKDTVLSQV